MPTATDKRQRFYRHESSCGSLENSILGKDKLLIGHAFLYHKQPQVNDQAALRSAFQ